MEKICVAVRVRPPISSTQTQDTNNKSNLSGAFWKVEDNRISLHKALGTPISGVSYTFGQFSPIVIISLSFYNKLFFEFVEPVVSLLLFSDHVFDFDSTNSRVYDHLTKHVIRAAVDGFNGILVISLSKLTVSRTLIDCNNSRNCICVWTNQQWENLHHEWLPTRPWDRSSGGERCFPKHYDGFNLVKDLFIGIFYFLFTEFEFPFLL